MPDESKAEQHLNMEKLNIFVSNRHFSSDIQQQKWIYSNELSNLTTTNELSQGLGKFLNTFYGPYLFSMNSIVDETQFSRAFIRLWPLRCCFNYTI